MISDMHEPRLVLLALIFTRGNALEKQKMPYFSKLDHKWCYFPSDIKKDDTLKKPKQNVEILAATASFTYKVESHTKSLF